MLLIHIKFVNLKDNNLLPCQLIQYTERVALQNQLRQFEARITRDCIT